MIPVGGMVGLCIALWARGGVVENRALAPNATLIAQRAPPIPESLWYGRVGKQGIRIFKSPNVHAPLASRRRISRELAFFPNVKLQEEGWFERVEGGFVRTKSVQLLVPSVFHGETSPRLPLAFVVSATSNGEETFRRYDVLSVQGIDRGNVITNRGRIARNKVRLVTRQVQPTLIPLGAKWVLIDLSQQTLTAYEGEVAVYATLISSGKADKDSRTDPGFFRVGHKFLYDNMHGDPPDPYVVDRVPYVQYYNGSEGLHGTYWHDQFGTPASHGCTNLSLADARWLFKWASPVLPDGWQSLEPEADGLPSLWVSVRPRTKPNFVLAEPQASN